MLPKDYRSAWFDIGGVRFYLKGYCDSMRTNETEMEFLNGTFDYLRIEDRASESGAQPPQADNMQR